MPQCKLSKFLISSYVFSCIHSLISSSHIRLGLPCAVFASSLPSKICIASLPLDPLKTCPPQRSKRSLNWPPKQTKEHKYQYKQEGERDRGEQTITCAVQVQVETQGRLHQPHLNRHLANGHLTLSSH